MDRPPSDLPWQRASPRGYGAGFSSGPRFFGRHAAHNQVQEKIKFWGGARGECFRAPNCRGQKIAYSLYDQTGGEDVHWNALGEDAVESTMSPATCAERGGNSFRAKNGWIRQPCQGIAALRPPADGRGFRGFQNDDDVQAADDGAEGGDGIDIVPYTAGELEADADADAAGAFADVDGGDADALGAGFDAAAPAEALAIELAPAEHLGHL
eukprot:tig00000145_g8846.t1